MNLETALSALAAHGTPMLWQSDRSEDGWRCRINVRVNAAGVTFEVIGKGPTHFEAASDCLTKMRGALHNFSSEKSVAPEDGRTETPEARQKRIIARIQERDRLSEPWDQATA